MGNPQDPNRNRKKYHDELERLETSEDVTPEDKDAIREFVNHTEVHKDQSVNTLKNKSKFLRLCAERSETPLTDLDPQGVTNLMLGFKRGTHPAAPDTGYSDGYVRNFRQALRLFYEHHGKEWYDEIKVGKPPIGKITEDDVLTSDETAELFSAAENPQSKALLAVLLATGQRISAIATLRIGDVNVERDAGEIYLNEDAIGLKGAQGARPLIWATEYVKNWLDVHPRRDDPDAPLFCATKRSHGTEKGEAVTIQAFSYRLYDLAERSEVPREKCNPHNFRHTAITRMVRDGLDEQKIKFMVGWKPDSTQFERYSHVQQREMIDDINAEYNLGDADVDVGPSFDNCPSCGAGLTEWANPMACPGCGLTLSHAARQTREEIEEDTYESAKEVDDDELEEALDVFRELMDKNPGLLDELTDSE